MNLQFVRDPSNAKNIWVEIFGKFNKISWDYREHLESMVKTDKDLKVLNKKLQETFNKQVWLDNVNLWIVEKFEEFQELDFD